MVLIHHYYGADLCKINTKTNTAPHVMVLFFGAIIAYM